jgi:hypothetical protein
LIMFKINDKVVCVRGARTTREIRCERRLIKGNLYVVTGVDEPNEHCSTWGLRVAGNRVWNIADFEIWWCASRFRKLEDLQNEAPPEEN